ncbi:STAS domain-containing protein [Motilibacter sp. E257]|uniref:Anti-sigma factor antagonist n=2 Tax=Motilibacter deserti TaxID=2714956 RepID=A0ABX0H2L9_9ACTN|nr:STAS domain-containing protein [Motilibacter deserti]NHC16200.1 STAS domain-containing protein [Motilibacter deserti]
MTWHDEEAATVVRIAGEIDAHTAPQLRTRLIEIVAEGRARLVLDLTGVTFFDSTALGVLVGAQRRVRALDGHLGVVTDRPLTVKVFRMTGLDKVIALHRTLQQALDWQATLPRAGG